MKITLLLTLALGFAGVSPRLAATTVDVYITGSTAFRANVYNACSKLFVSPTIYYADGNHGGTTLSSPPSASSAPKISSWVMTGSPVSALTNLQGNTLTVHGFFTGSVQGIETTENEVPLIFAAATGTPNQNCSAYVTNAPTIGFSDASGVATPYPASGNYVEEQVCVQPFVICKSTASVGAVTSITNVTWEQLEYGMTAGRIPLSAWTGHITDTNTFVYLMQRTKDSGTRRTETQGEYYQYNDPVGIYLYDYTNNFFYTPTVTANTGYGFSPNGVIGTEGPGLGNANLNWGFGYIGGGDIANSLNNGNAANQAIAYLSVGDSKGVGSANWANVISYNGIWPTAAGAGIHGNTGTNDYSPITLGYYPLWGFEVLVHPTVPDVHQQDISQFELGDEYTPGSFMGVFNAQSFNNGGVVLQGSIEADIISGQPSGATGIPLAAMVNTRPSVGGTIFPPFQ